MKSKLLKEGIRTISDIISGKDIKINYMYIEYKTLEYSETTAKEDKDIEYFNTLKEIPGCGYIRVPIQTSFVDTNNNVQFIASINADMCDHVIAGSSMFTEATLAAGFESYATKDKFISSSIFNQPIPIVPGSIITAQVTLSFGD